MSQLFIQMYMENTIPSLIPGHHLATWLMTHITGLLDRMGLSREPSLEEVIYVCIIVIFALLLGWLVKLLVLWITRKFVAAHNTETGSELLRQHVFSRCSHAIPPLVILALIPFAFEGQSKLLHIFELCLIVYTIMAITNALCTVVSFIWRRFDKRNNTKNLPLQGILYVCNGIIWIVASIIAVSVLVGKSPAVLLTGLGAFAAAIMLIFKDSILGFVAGIQLSQNDMLRIGDWIVVPSTIANGIVTEVSLSAVKVRNWDNTIVTLPPYTLVSTSFQNWRGMSQSGWRLISRNFYFDTDSVTQASPELLAEVSELPGMKSFIDRINTEGQFYDSGVAVVNGTLESNLGLFRAYMCAYLLAHPLVAHDRQILVRVMAPDTKGIPLQIYCYTSTAWTAYEAVQSEIFEHIALKCQIFGLKACSGDYRDVKITAGEDIALHPMSEKS